MFGSFLSLVVASLPLLAQAGHHPNLNRHRELAHRPRGDVSKRSYTSARWTYYAVGLGACGQTNVPSDFIVALNSDQFGGGYPGPHCFETITMTFNGKTTTATIMDECPGCPEGGLDLSTGLFSFFDDMSVGVIYGTWSFNDGSSGGGGDSPTTTTTKHTTTAKPTTTWEEPTTTHYTPTTTYTPPPPTTTEKPETTSASSSSSSSAKPSSSSVHSSSEVKSSSAPSVVSSALSAVSSAAAAEPSAGIENLYQAFIDMGSLVVAGVNA